MTDAEKLEYIKNIIKDMFVFDAEEYMMAINFYRTNKVDIGIDELYIVYRTVKDILMNVFNISTKEIMSLENIAIDRVHKNISDGIIIGQENKNLEILDTRKLFTDYQKDNENS